MLTKQQFAERVATLEQLLEIEILGVNEDGTIFIQSNHHRRIVKIDDVDRLTVAKLSMHFGGAPLFQAMHNKVTTAFSLESIKRHLAAGAGAKFLNRIHGVPVDPSETREAATSR